MDAPWMSAVVPSAGFASSASGSGAPGRSWAPTSTRTSSVPPVHFSTHFNPPAAAAERLIGSISEIFAALGGEAGRGLPELLRETGVKEPELDAHVIALKPGHPYLRVPLQFSIALESRLLERLSEDELASLRREAESELAEPGRWGTTFTLIQSWGRPQG